MVILGFFFFFTPSFQTLKWQQSTLAHISFIVYPLKSAIPTTLELSNSSNIKWTCNLVRLACLVLKSNALLMQIKPNVYLGKELSEALKQWAFIPICWPDEKNWSKDIKGTVKGGGYGGSRQRKNCSSNHLKKYCEINCESIATPQFWIMPRQSFH